MEVLECLQCRGQIVLQENGQVGKCASCDTVYFYKAEKNARLISLLNQANISRLRGDFDGAILAYKIALKEDETDADAYWGLTLSKFGIEYVEDERTKELLPTCRRTMKHSILSDEDYLNALSFASAEQQTDFIEKAEEIERLQLAIKEKVEKEQDYDVFLCFKSSDNDGNPTEDRVIARQIYNELEKHNIKTFFSEVSLKNRLGQDYEPIIYKALYTTKIFILISTKEEYIQAPWVRNEWSRFRDRMLDEGMSNVSFAVFKDIKQNQLPPIFRTQGVDLAKYPAGGYEVEIADNLTSRLKGGKFTTLDSFFSDNNSMIFEEKVVDLLEKKLVGSRQTYDEKIERALTYHEIGNSEKALEILDGIIDEYPRKSMGWFCKAKLLTENFEINISKFHIDKELKEDVLFALENAARFASEEEKETITQNTSTFYLKLKTIETVDEGVKNMEDNLEKLLKLENQKQSYNNENNQDKSLDKDYSSALAANTKLIKQLKKQISNKKYYTKNISIPTSFFQIVFQMIGFFVIIIAVIASLINFLTAKNDSSKILSTLLEFILLIMVGSSPFFITAITKNNAKLKQVKDYLERDKKEYEQLRQENQKIKATIVRLSQPNQDDNQAENNKDNQFNSSFLKQEKAIVNDYKNLKKLYNENDYIQEYINLCEENNREEILTKQDLMNAEKTLLVKEQKHIKDQQNKVLNELKQKKPKYLSESYEKMVKSTTILMDKFVAKKVQIEERITEIDFENKLLILKLEKTVSNPDFFEDFLIKYKADVDDYLQPKVQEEQPAVPNEIVKKKKNKKKKKKKKHNSKK